MDETQLDGLLKKLAIYLANELDKRSDLLSRVEDLEELPVQVTEHGRARRGGQRLTGRPAK